MVADPRKVLELTDTKKLYDELLWTSNRFLYNCGRWSVELLQSEEPSFSEIADIMRKVAGIIELLCDEFDPMMAQQAKEYADLMVRMGQAIDTGDQMQLNELRALLKRKPGV